MRFPKSKEAILIIELINGEERIMLDEISKLADSISIGMHIFNTEIIAKLEGNSLKGRWIKNDFENYSIPFKANLVEDFATENPIGKVADISGKWSVVFQNEEEDKVMKRQLEFSIKMGTQSQALS